ncbi:hypothetical protein CYY_003359 [Polysphondylium violaceum]|uniref:Uncharacterized protein n=1 Tax=Polysphondylium violaceum TaxID=133409 RepID=A0A8J4V091_9MYCE|nr:hypothetical protein CYY_003359 [Polysphondylium violaceum]
MLPTSGAPGDHPLSNSLIYLQLVFAFGTDPPSCSALSKGNLGGILDGRLVSISNVPLFNSTESNAVIGRGHQDSSNLRKAVIDPDFSVLLAKEQQGSICTTDNITNSKKLTTAKLVSNIVE